MEYRGKTLTEAVQKALHNERVKRTEESHSLESKGSGFVHAPSGFWGRWEPIYTQISGNPFIPRILAITLAPLVPFPSTYNVEIKGGDEFVETIGPGAIIVTITGNIATQVSMRCKSHTVAGDAFYFFI